MCLGGATNNDFRENEFLLFGFREEKGGDELLIFSFWLTKKNLQNVLCIDLLNTTPMEKPK